MLTLVILAVAVVSTSALPTPELQRNAYDEYDEFQRLTPKSKSTISTEALQGAGPKKVDSINKLKTLSSLTTGLADVLPEWNDRQDIFPLSARLPDQLGNELFYGPYGERDIDMSKRRVDSLGGNNLVRRSLDRLGGNQLVKKALDRLGGGHLVRRALDTLGGYSLVKRRIDPLGGNSLVKRTLDSLGGNSLVKRMLDSLGRNSLVKTNLDSLDGDSSARPGNRSVYGLEKRRLDSLGGNSLVKRTLDSLGGNSLVKRRLDTIGGNRLVRRSLNTMDGRNLIKRSREGSSKSFIDKLGGGHLLKRSPEAPESLDSRDQDSEAASPYKSTDSYGTVDDQKDTSYVRPLPQSADTLSDNHVHSDSPLSYNEALELLQLYDKVNG